MKTTRAYHDLNNVKELVVLGWGAKYDVVRKDHTAPRVEIESPDRIGGREAWTFQRVDGRGKMVCHSMQSEPRYTGRNDPNTGKPWPKLIVTLLLPKDHPGVKVTVRRRG